MKQIATVYKVENGRAYLVAAQQSACAGCHAGEGCAACRSKPITFKTANSLSAAVGDRVEVESDDRRILFYALCTFLFPVLAAAACFIGAGLLGTGEPLQIAAALVGMAACFFLLRLTLDKKAGSRDDVAMRRILPQEETNETKEN